MEIQGEAVAVEDAEQDARKKAELKAKKKAQRKKHNRKHYEKGHPNAKELMSDNIHVAVERLS